MIEIGQQIWCLCRTGKFVSILDASVCDVYEDDELTYISIDADVDDLPLSELNHSFFLNEHSAISFATKATKKMIETPLYAQCDGCINDDCENCSRNYADLWEESNK